MRQIEGFNIRFVAKGDRYGHEDCMVHERDEPLIEFYDAIACKDFGERGQFVTRYFISTLRFHQGELNLCGGVPVWVISDVGMRQVSRLIETYIQETRKCASH